MLEKAKQLLVIELAEASNQPAGEVEKILMESVSAGMDIKPSPVS